MDFYVSPVTLLFESSLISIAPQKVQTEKEKGTENGKEKGKENVKEKVTEKGKTLKKLKKD